MDNDFIIWKFTFDVEINGIRKVVGVDVNFIHVIIGMQDTVYNLFEVRVQLKKYMIISVVFILNELSKLITNFTQFVNQKY